MNVSSVSARAHHGLAAEGLAAVTQLERLPLSGGGPRRHGGTAAEPVVQAYVDLDRGIAAAVEDLPRVDRRNVLHLLNLGRPGRRAIRPGPLSAIRVFPPRSRLPKQ